MTDKTKFAFTLEMESADDILTLLNELVGMLDAIQAGPTPDDLATAPELDNWRVLIDITGVPVLWGNATGHEETEDGVIIITPRLLGLGADRTWARTEETWYRLGEAMSYAQAEAVRMLAEAAGDVSATAFDHPDLIQISTGPFLDRLLADSDLRIRAISGGLAQALRQVRAAEAEGDCGKDADEEQDAGRQEEAGGGEDGNETGEVGDGQPT